MRLDRCRSQKNQGLVKAIFRNCVGVVESAAPEELLYFWQLSIRKVSRSGNGNLVPSQAYVA